MQESQFGFEYSWADTQPIRALVVMVHAAQILGAVLGMVFVNHDSWFMRLWLGAALATFPAFLVGLAVQARVRPGSIGENRVMVRRLGMIALLFSAMSFMPWGES